MAVNLGADIHERDGEDQTIVEWLQYKLVLFRCSVDIYIKLHEKLVGL